MLICGFHYTVSLHFFTYYQGYTTLEAHDVPLMPEPKTLGATSQIVSVLTSTMSLLYHHGHLCRKLLYQPEVGVVSQGQALQVHGDSQG